MDINDVGSTATSLTRSDIINVGSAGLRWKGVSAMDNNVGDSTPTLLTRSGSETCQPVITPRRLPFTVIDNVAYMENVENIEVPLSCINQGTTQNNLTTEPIREKSERECSHDITHNASTTKENTRAHAS